MFGKLKEMLAKKEITVDKESAELEKGDFLALLIAAASFMIPALLLVFLFFGLIIWVVF